MIKQIRLGAEPLENIQDINSNFDTLSGSISALKPGQPGGVATLDSGGKLNKNQLPLVDAVPVEKRDVILLYSFDYDLPESAPDGSYCYKITDKKLYIASGGGWLGPFDLLPEKLYIGPDYTQIYCSAGSFGLVPIINEMPNSDVLIHLGTMPVPPYSLTYMGDPLMMRYADYWTFKDIVKLSMVSGYPDFEGNQGDAAYDAATKTLYLCAVWGWEELTYDSYSDEYYPYIFGDFIQKKPELLFFDKANSKLYGFTASLIRNEMGEVTKVQIDLITVS